MYLIPLFRILEECGLKAYLVNTHYLKSVRRTQERCIRLAVDPVSAPGGVAAGRMRVSYLSPAPGIRCKLTACKCSRPTRGCNRGCRQTNHPEV